MFEDHHQPLNAGDLLAACAAALIAACAALIADQINHPVTRLVLLEPVLVALALSLPGPRRIRFRAAGWNGVIILSFTLSGLEAARDQYDAAATFLFVGIAFAFVSGVPVVAIDHALRLRDNFRDLAEWARSTTREAAEPAGAGPRHPFDGAAYERDIRARWAARREAEEARIRANPLTTVEGWNALRRRREPGASPAESNED